MLSLLYKISKGVKPLKLQESGEMYIESIYVLSKTLPIVRAIDICDHRGVSKPSVSRAVGLLKQGGYIDYEENGNLLLTEKGKEVAEKIYERHTVLTAYLEQLGISKDTATEDACKIEHVISDETFNAIKKHIKI